MSVWLPAREFAEHSMRFVLVAACSACGNTASGARAMNANLPVQDAGDVFGNAAGNSAPHAPLLMLIDDGGAGVLPDGEVIYLAWWARPCPSDSTLTYQSFGQDFFQSYCLRCHSAENVDRGGAPAGVNFDQLDAIRARKEAIWGVAADDHTLMPEAGAAPSDDERRLLGDWLACGAKSEMDTAALE